MNITARALRIIADAKQKVADRDGRVNAEAVIVFLAIELAKSRAFGFMRDKPFEPTREMKLDDKGPVI